MRYQTIVPLFLALFSLQFFSQGCECVEDPDIEAQKVSAFVHLQSNFAGDQVVVTIDGRRVFDQSVTTNHLLGLAESFEVSLSPGSHTVLVKVNEAVQKSESFIPEETPFILVGYHEGKVTMNFTDEKPLYD